MTAPDRVPAPAPEGFVAVSRSRLRRFADAFVDGPAYPASAADRRTIRIVGLDLPFRATTAIVVMTMVILVDFTRLAIPQDIQALGRAAEALRYQSFERVVLFGLVPALVVVGLFRDRLIEYGLTVGAWRWGLGLAIAGCAVMTPIIVGLGGTAEFAAYYGVSGASIPDIVVTNVLDLVPAEFLLRGFLMFTLLRTIGPLGIVAAQIPFVFVHLGKPELELFSTLFGGTVFGWLDWRTRSIAWSALGHVYILTLVTVVAVAHVPAAV